MPLNVNITGLDKLQRDLEEAQRACESLGGTLTTLKINPADPKGVKEAIQEMEAAVDSKTAPYCGNMLVLNMAQALKQKHREQILERYKTGQK